MREIIECVPNFSTSDPKVVEAILNEIRRVENAYILDYTFDDYYNRLVVSFVGNRRSVLDAALNAARKAVELIDMTKHKGQHPRIGAVDVVPFIPIKGVTMQDCVEIAKKFGETLARELNVPVYLYAEAATKPERRDLDWIRKGEYEKLGEMIVQPDRKPDFGPAEPHPTAGATITGARKLMAGFNVNLGTSDLKIAKKIAKALHSKKGGLAQVKAMAAYIPEKNMTQIGMSIADYEKTPLYRVFELLKIEAQRYNVPIVSSEFCGMAPLKALIDTARYYLKIENLTEDRVIEIAIQKAAEEAQKPGAT
ncbi:MAG TPA: glutamate formimidoyltransferase [Candidatus Bathyarchaeota archaeon]|nr:MAG: glutamate formimidoyltransferase [Candidatus Bathyarchaeota archaeon ex4484_231]HDI07576.1 glutamate formimidoyltransferase [Candidatus Bathyarchaeota archaeon]